jgi:hypothetical protein
MKIDECRKFASRLKVLAERHGLEIGEDIDPQSEEFIPDATYIVDVLFPQRTVSHAIEQGEAPSDIYPNMLERYALVSNGEFRPENIEVDSDDGWESAELAFDFRGERHKFVVRNINDSDYFSPAFVPALNRFAKRVDILGRWVAFYNGDDSCSSIYVPVTAYIHFRKLKDFYSKE